MKPGFFALAALIACNVFAVPVSVKDPAGKPLATVMVSRLPMNPAELPGKRSLAARLKLSFVPGRSGDILAVLKPFITFDDPPYAVSHGSAWDYDRRVPLVFFGPWATEKRSEPVRTVDLAPTLMKELGLKLQEAVDGHALELKTK